MFWKELTTLSSKVSSSTSIILHPLWNSLICCAVLFFNRQWCIQYRSLCHCDNSRIRSASSSCLYGKDLEEDQPWKPIRTVIYYMGTGLRDGQPVKSVGIKLRQVCELLKFFLVILYIDTISYTCCRSFLFANFDMQSYSRPSFQEVKRAYRFSWYFALAGPFIFCFLFVGVMPMMFSIVNVMDLVTFKAWVSHTDRSDIN